MTLCKINRAKKWSMVMGSVAAMALLASCGEQKNQSEVRTVSFSVVSKSDSAPFFARYATDTSRIAVGESQSGLSGLKVEIPAAHQLYMVEYRNEGAAKVSEEVYREGRVVFYVAKDLREATLITNNIEEFAHPKEVNTDKLKQPTALQTVSDAKTSEMESSSANVNFWGRSIVIDTAKMKEDLESLSGARPITVDGQTVTLANRATTANKAKARAWLKAVYESLGFVVSEHRYSTGINFIAEKRANAPVDDKIIMVSGHLDTVQTAGADDDGSGVISSLSIARAVSAMDFARTVRFVAFDEEERGLIGSTAYVNELVRTGDIAKVSLLNIEMTGYDSDNDGAFHAIDCNENTSSTISQAVTDAIASEGIALKKIAACTNRSDHAAFWEHDRPAIVVSQNFFGGDDNPCYHRTCDNVSRFNWDYMGKMTKAAAVALLNIVEAK